MRAMIGGMYQWQALAGALNRTMASSAPGWTNRNDSDPGITVLEVMVYLAESLHFYDNNIERGSAAAVRIVDALKYVGTIKVENAVAVAESWSGTKRPNYFSGKLMSADDLTEEQNYLLEKHRRHLRTLHGIGIVDGLQVSVDEQGETIAIDPGLAVDAHGREIQLNQGVTLLVPKNTSSPVLVVVEYTERFVDPVPVAEDELAKPSRIEEGARVVLTEGPGETGVALARLISEQNAWRVDPSFAPARAR